MVSDKGKEHRGNVLGGSEKVHGKDNILARMRSEPEKDIEEELM